VNRLVYVVFLALFVLGGETALTTPFFTQDPRTLPAGKWRVETHLLSSHYEHSLVDGDEVPLLSGDSASASTYQTRIRYGAADKLTLFVDIPYVRKTVCAGGVRRISNGRGDVALLVKYNIHDDRARGTRAAVALSTKLATGDYRNLPPELALGTGQTNWILVLLGEKQVGIDTYYASVAYVDTGERTDVDTDPGQVFRANVAIEHKVGDSPCNIVGELNYFHQGRFERVGETVETSGSTILNAAIGAQYAPRLQPGRLLIVESEIQFPIHSAGYSAALPDYTYYLGAWTVF